MVPLAVVASVCFLDSEDVVTVVVVITVVVFVTVVVVITLVVVVTVVVASIAPRPHSAP